MQNAWRFVKDEVQRELLKEAKDIGRSRYFPQKVFFGESVLSAPLMNAGHFEGSKSMAKRRNGESRAAQRPAAHTTDAHERDKDFLTPARSSACWRVPRRQGTASAVTC